jgi:hypothetical protein
VDSWRVAFLRTRRVTPPAAAARDCAAVAEQSALWRERRGRTKQSAPFRARRSSRQWGGMWRHEAGLGIHGHRASVASRGSGAFGRRHETVWAMKEIVASRNDVAAQPLPLTADGAPRLHPRGGSSRGGGGAKRHRENAVVVSCGDGTGSPSNKGMKLTKGGWSRLEAWCPAVATGLLVLMHRGSGVRPSQLIPGVRPTGARCREAA